MDPGRDPIALFESWFQDAEQCPEIRYAHAMCLATVDEKGHPDARTILLLHHHQRGFVFFTDRRSAKARQLEPSAKSQTAHAALTFYWGPLERQIRIRGPVAAASEEISDLCFSERPLGSRITAWATCQSQVMGRREELLARYANEERRLRGLDEVPRPPHWQAYRVVAQSLEFWEARANRLHERHLYQWAPPEEWRLSRLEP
ncbi:MAG: pyridoxamine 5'-phosphate oxidase [Deltaproteobacteria bacterium]|nr:pyridoxamine 5'-phosphate oxidase [Deltaproteobacteria bacterium]